MTDHALLIKFLASCVTDYTASHPGCSEVEASFVVLQSMTVITPANVAAWEQDAHILDLLGKGLAPSLVGSRLGCSREHVHRVAKRHQDARRAALRLSA
jgi:hypothetical protein